MQVFHRLEDLGQRAAAEAPRERFRGLGDAFDGEFGGEGAVAGELGVDQGAVEVEQDGVAGDGGHGRIMTQGGLAAG